ncbi:hypothetical protein CDAR_445061 [Caerostris darwini]|uniref:Uncharacterized protein n=1 Tax=Caerostris darwini TaxID=1538125 RepID=A0AAV4MN35_9ARAC|nr:hypothetical protein CDAR_445061 [Caerostris darwini]
MATKFLGHIPGASRMKSQPPTIYKLSPAEIVPQHGLMMECIFNPSQHSPSETDTFSSNAHSSKDKQRRGGFQEEKPSFLSLFLLCSSFFAKDCFGQPRQCISGNNKGW